MLRVGLQGAHLNPSSVASIFANVASGDGFFLFFFSFFLLSSLVLLCLVHVVTDGYVLARRVSILGILSILSILSIAYPCSTLFLARPDYLC